MKKFLQICFGVAIFGMGFSQDLKPVPEKVQKLKLANKTFTKYNFFTVDQSPQKATLYKAAAEDVTVMQLKNSEIKKINNEKPETLEMSFPFEGREVTLELVKNNIFTNDFKVNTDKGYVNYTPGVYYQGIVKGDNESIVAFSFFENEVVGVASIKNVGNIVLGKAKNSSDYVSYNDQKLKGTNPFSCGADLLPENQKMNVSYDPSMAENKKTDNCVRIYYEAGFGPYQQQGSSVTQTTNWVTAMHNNIATLYTNDGITVALSEVYVWTTMEPIPNVSSTYTPSQVLNAFRNLRTTFNGDVAQLLKNPATTSIAWVDALCTNYKYSFSGVNSTYSNVPTYSWNIEAMTHEIGHNLGSPHTHACAWNGNSTAIDGCGPAAGANEGCNGPLPTSTGGTIMSYCHLVSSVGINFANGFGPQPGALIRNKVNTKGCLGSNCTTSCPQTVTGVTFSNVTYNSATVLITDNVETSWKYKVSNMDGTVVSSGTTTNKSFTVNGLLTGSYYKVSIGTSCSGPQAFQKEALFMTDANWCLGIQFLDPGLLGNYDNNQFFVKTFYPLPGGGKVKLTFTEFDLEPQDPGSVYDYMTIYNGPNTSSPVFTGGNQLNGDTVPGPFTSTHSTGAITVVFSSDAGVTGSGWVAYTECAGLATSDNEVKNEINISRTTQNGIFNITSKDRIIEYSIHDGTGKLILNAEKVNSTSERINLTSSPKGIYIVTVKTSTETVTKKIVK